MTCGTDTKMPKESKNYKRMMAEIIKKKNTVKTENDRKKIKQSVGGGKSKQVEQI